MIFPDGSLVDRGGYTAFDTCGIFTVSSLCHFICLSIIHHVYWHELMSVWDERENQGATRVFSAFEGN